MTWVKLIRKLKEDFGLTDEELANKGKVTRTAISSIKSGLTRNPSLYTITNIERDLGIKIITDDPEDIYYIKGEQQTNKLQPFELNINPSSMVKLNYFPIIQRVRAGMSNTVQEEDVLGHIALPYQDDANNGGGAVAVIVEGDSMSPELSHGDIVLIDKNKEVYNKCIVVAVFKNGEHTIKRYRELTDDLIELTPTNTVYEPKIYHKEKVESLYRVVWIAKKSF